MSGSNKSTLYNALPPTPPKDDPLDDELNKIIQSLDSESSLHDAGPSTAYNTPPTSSPFLSLPSHLAPSPSRKRKRIRFESVCDEIPSDPPVSVEDLTSSSAQTKPVRSILKPFDLSLIHYNTPSSQPSLLSTPTMLDSVLSQLAETSTSARTDAYQILNNSLRAYKEIPDAAAFKSKLPVLEKYLRRDIGTTEESPDKPDFRFVALALKLVISLFADRRGTADDLSDDFVQWLSKITAGRLSAHGIPKEIVKNHMYLFSIDNFCSRALSGQRCTDVVAALHSIHKRVSGAIVQGLRMTIFARLLDHSPSSMLHLLPSWLPIVLQAALSSAVDIRSHAIEAGLLAGRALGGKQRMATVFLDYCNSKRPSTGTTNIQNFKQGVEGFLFSDDTEANAEVPRICGMVALFLRSAKQPLEQWQHFEEWATLLHRCFAIREPRIRMRSFSALNRFIFVLKPHMNLKPTTFDFLLRPILDNLKSEAAPLEAGPARDAAWSSFYLLLYYGFRPHSAQTERQISFHWRELVDKVMVPIAHSSEYGSSQIYRLLAFMFEKSTLRTWNEEQVHRNFRAPVRQSEVPKIDPMWTRANAKVVLNTFGQLDVPTRLFHLDSENGQLFLQAWSSFMVSNHDAFSTEVTLSGQSRRAFREILLFLQRHSVTSLEHLAENQREVRVQACQRRNLQMLDTTFQAFQPLPLLRTEIQEHSLQGADHPTGSIMIAAAIGLNTAEANCPNKPWPRDESLPGILNKCFDAASSNTSALRFMREVASYSSGSLRSLPMKDDSLEFSLGDIIIRALQKAVAKGALDPLNRPVEVAPMSRPVYEQALAILQVFMEPRNELLWVKCGGTALETLMDKVETDLGHAGATVLLRKPATFAALSDGSSLSLAARTSLTRHCLRLYQANDMPMSIASVAAVLNSLLTELTDRDPLPADSLLQLGQEVVTVLTSDRLDSSKGFLVASQTGLLQLIGKLTTINDSQLSASLSSIATDLLVCVKTHCKEDASSLDSLEPLLIAFVESGIPDLAWQCSEICKEFTALYETKSVPTRLQEALRIHTESSPRHSFAQSIDVASVENEPQQRSSTALCADSMHYPSKTLVTANTDNGSGESLDWSKEAAQEDTPQSAARAFECDEHVPSSPIESIQRARSQRARMGQLIQPEQVAANEEEVPSSPPQSTSIRHNDVGQRDFENILESSLDHNGSELFETAHDGEAPGPIGETNAPAGSQSHHHGPGAIAHPKPSSKNDTTLVHAQIEHSQSKYSLRSFQPEDGIEESEVAKSTVRLRDREMVTTSFYEAVRQYRASQASQASQSVEGSDSLQGSQAKRPRGRPPKSSTPTSNPTSVRETRKRRRSKSPTSANTERRKSARLSGISPRQTTQSLSNNDAVRRLRSRSQPRSRRSSDAPDQAAQKPSSASYTGSLRRSTRRTPGQRRETSLGHLRTGLDGSMDGTSDPANEDGAIAVLGTEPEGTADESELQVPSSVRSTASSHASFVNSFTGRLMGLYEDAKKLFLGDERRADDRQNIEDLTTNLETELRAAKSRKRG